MTRPLNHMRMFLAPDELRPFVVDWPDVAAALLARARHEAMAAPLDLALQSTWRELLKLPRPRSPRWRHSAIRNQFAFSIRLSSSRFNSAVALSP